MKRIVELTKDFALDVVTAISGFAYGFLVITVAIFLDLLVILFIAFLV